MTALLPALAGANLIYGLGMLESGITLGFGQMVMDNEFAAMIRHVLPGIPADDESLATDLIKEIGIGGNHLTAAHTMKYVRNYQSCPKLIDRNMMDAWVADGSVGLKEKCDIEARRILETHQPVPIPEDAAKIIAELIAKEEKDRGIS